VLVRISRRLWISSSFVLAGIVLAYPVAPGANSMDALAKVRMTTAIAAGTESRTDAYAETRWRQRVGAIPVPLLADAPASEELGCFSGESR
jgi:hypothetical protein